MKVTMTQEEGDELFTAARTTLQRMNSYDPRRPVLIKAIAKLGRAKEIIFEEEEDDTEDE